MPDLPVSARESIEPNVNILLVDDNAGNLIALEAVLADLGQNLVKALSGEEALRLLLQKDFAVVLLDVQMQGLDGFETAKVIRGRERSRHTPVIFLTAYDSPGFAPAKAYTLGAVDYLVKPLVPAILRAKVQVFVELFQKTERLRQLEREEADRRLAHERLRQREEASQAKDRFLAMLAHELRNPLGPILHGVNVARHAAADNRVREQALGMMERQARHLSRLVDDILEATRVSRRNVQLRLERIDLSRLVRTAIDDRRHMFERAGLNLILETPDTPVWVKGDETRLVQILDNLIENAVKYSDRGGRVTIRVSGESSTREATLTVADTGIGIEPDMLPRIFETFSQADHSLDRARGGLGLGLSVVKGLVELHSGQVAASSQGLGQGAEFIIRLPSEEEPAALSEAPTTPYVLGNGSRVLIIEDNDDAALSLRMLLELLGHQVSVAHSGPEGVKRAVADRPQVVLSDIGLPGLDGFEVARRIRKQPGMEEALLIALTGYSDAEIRWQSQQAGFDYHLVKPADPAALTQIMTRRGGAA